MCGIVCFFGHADGIARVLEALHLLEYRAPDSSGLATIDEYGRLAVRRCVGSPRRLVAKMSAEPLYCSPSRVPKGIARLLRRQGLALTPGDLRDVSVEAGYSLDDLYRPGGLQVGIGDASHATQTGSVDPSGRFSERMRGALSESAGLASPDYDLDPLAHAFRLVAAQVAGREACDPAWKAALDRILQERLPGGAYASWREAWEEEVAHRVPGVAFAVAVRRFQETFPGLAQELSGEDWERLGGLTTQAMAQIVLGHGRWAMVGAVTDANAHPVLDHSGTRALCENGSHNASLMQGARAEQERWWRARGVPPGGPLRGRWVLPGRSRPLPGVRHLLRQPARPRCRPLLRHPRTSGPKIRAPRRRARPLNRMFCARCSQSRPRMAGISIRSAAGCAITLLTDEGIAAA